MKAKHVGIIIWVIVAVAFIFCFWYFGIKNIVSSDEPEDDESGINTFNYSCPHDDTYQEPTLNMGKYYPNGFYNRRKQHSEIQRRFGISLQ